MLEQLKLWFQSFFTSQREGMKSDMAEVVKAALPKLDDSLKSELDKAKTALQEAQGKVSAEQSKVTAEQGKVSSLTAALNAVCKAFGIEGGDDAKISALTTDAKISALTAAHKELSGKVSAQTDLANDFKNQLESANAALTADCLACNCLELTEQDGKTPLDSNATAEQKTAAANRIPFADRQKAYSGALHRAASKIGVDIKQVPPAAPSVTPPPKPNSNGCAVDSGALWAAKTK